MDIVILIPISRGQSIQYNGSTLLLIYVAVTVVAVIFIKLSITTLNYHYYNKQSHTA